MSIEKNYLEEKDPVTSRLSFREFETLVNTTYVFSRCIRIVNRKVRIYL